MAEDDYLDYAAGAARIGTKIVNASTYLVTLALFIIGGYIIWYTFMVYQSAFLDDDLLKYKPVIDGDENPSLYDLMAINPDVCAWITIEDTAIDYPVVQGKDNQEYLDKNVFGDYTPSGAIYLDKNNSRDFTDPYNILYGHHMASGQMFGQILKFLDEDFFNTHPYGVLFLPEKTYAISIFACMETNAYEPRILTVIKDKAEMPSFLAYTHNNAVQYRDLSPALSTDDTIIGLVTCERVYTDGRVVLLGRLNEVDFVKQGDDKQDSGSENEWFDQ